MAAATAAIAVASLARAGTPASPTALPGGLIPAAAPAEAPRWRISAGPAWRDLGEIRFRTGSRSQHVRLPLLVGREVMLIPPAAGHPQRVTPREYLDGFVRTDGGTARDGLTWNWGYQRASQIEGDQLVLSLPGGVQREVDRWSRHRRSGWSDDPGFEPGAFIEIDRRVAVTGRAAAGPQLNFSFVSAAAQQRSSTFLHHQQATTSSLLLTDRFDLGGIIPPLAPYAGTEQGPGPLIGNVPSARRLTAHPLATERATFFNRVDESLDVDLFTIGAGGHLEVRRGPIFVQGAAGVTLNVADWDAAHREQLLVSAAGASPRTARTWQARAHGTDVLLGAYIQAKVGVQLSERVSVAGFARYDWSQRLRGDVGPSSFAVDLDGMSAGVVVGVSF